ncbi:cell wall metabolism sensor histidine kinase WalK [Chitinophaga sp. CF418]|uniref:sensor histidine kinase n=1 Tax=Chitinophaga sp. CF418 TaxID=1855287 RepID=UPI0009192552|nr:HAMP domain-containing sensor histidine kinase [Chitinophaga sp. CF418]SHN18999.1 His Kinase A (phospho-acceptor) domain-containing protein [Chitinophaga sp. CF418]
MGKVRKRIWWIAIPALLAVLLFQAYWLWQTYQSQQEAFMATTTEAFHNVYDNAIIITAKIKSGGKLAEKKYSVQATIDVNKSSAEDTLLAGPKAFIVYDSTEERQKTFIPENIHLDTSIANTNMSFDTMSPLAHFVSTVFSSFTDVTPDIDTLHKYYRRELDRKHIPLSFKILIGKEIDTTISRPTVMIYPGINNPKKMMGVQFGGLNTYLLKKMGSAIILSIFIAFLIIGCIWTLWRIILQQEKLENMKREFISHVTHELKTPVSILKATNEALLTFRGIEDPDKTARYLRHSKAELDKLQDLIDKIMQVTREEQEQQPLSVTPADLKTLVNDAVIRFSHLPGVNIRQQYDIQEGHFQTDITAFNTILTNLLDNAVKYNDKSRTEILVSVKELTGHYSFTVKDNGNGIEKQHFPFLFDKFYRVVQGDRHDIKGYGLGLSHVKALLHQLYGSISVSSIPGNGTTFIFQLPKYEKDQAATG